MSMRVYEIAKELNVPSKELVVICKEMNLAVKSHMSTLDDKAVAAVKAKLASPTADATPKTVAAAAPKAAVVAPETKAPPVTKAAPAPKTAVAAPETKAPPVTKAAPAPQKSDATPRSQTSPSAKKSIRSMPMRRMLKAASQETRRREGVRQPDSHVIQLPVNARELSATIGVKVNQIIGYLMRQGVMVNQNAPLDEETIMLIASDFDKTVIIRQEKDIEQELVEEMEKQDDNALLETRDPCVAFLGHVDHGKTSLLDYIRKAKVQAGEAGGITQHIGAYRATVGKKHIVFLDTPGHKAFTAMRARGAKVTDIVVLVIAADDGVMPQTEEAINHAKTAGVAIVVAINKVDRAEANVDRLKQQLAKLGLQPEDWGGSTVCMEVSAITGQGINELLEMIILEAEMLELKGAPSRKARGVVIEAQVKAGQGAVATVLIKDGTLNRGDVVICGNAFGKVRAIHDDQGRQLQKAGPSTPVQIFGLSDLPEAGAQLVEVENIKKAKEVARERAQIIRERSLVVRDHVSLENIFERIQAEDGSTTLRLVLKADVKGSLEVLKSSINDLPSKEVSTKILHAAIGGINESDVLLAHASDAIIVGFNVTPDDRARRLAQDKNVDIQLFQVIYELTDSLIKALEGMLHPDKKEVTIGHAEVRNTFKISRIGSIAGCYVRDGKITRNASVRLTRDGVIIYNGKLESLRRFTDDAREVREGFECGVKIAGYNDVKNGDVIEFFQIEEVARKLE